MDQRLLHIPAVILWLRTWKAATERKLDSATQMIVHNVQQGENHLHTGDEEEQPGNPQKNITRVLLAIFGTADHLSVGECNLDEKEKNIGEDDESGAGQGS